VAARLAQVAQVADMQQIEHAVGEGDARAARAKWRERRAKGCGFEDWAWHAALQCWGASYGAVPLAVPEQTFLYPLLAESVEIRD
jgi:hypothetical protein